MLRVLWILVATAAIASAAPNKGPFRKIAVIHLRDTSENMIDDSVRESVLRRLEAAKEWGADCIILDIESYGGLVTASLETGDEVFDLGRKIKGSDRDIHVLAYVGRKAISGAAMIAISCEEIVMSPSATLGDSQVINGATGEVAPEKFQTTVAATFRKYAEGNGYPIPLAEAMVRIEMEVSRYKKPRDLKDPSQGFSWVYYRTDGMDDGPSANDIESMGLHDRELVVRVGNLGTFTASECLDYGIASRHEPTLDALIESIGAPDVVVNNFEWSAAERVARFLLGIRGVLFLIGLGALYFALKMPGTGIPEILALVCFGLFFGAAWVAQLAGPLEVILFFGGVALIVAEIFVIPGFGVPGLLGLCLILASIGMAAVPEGGVPETGPVPYLIPVARDFLLAMIGSILLAIVIARYLPKTPLFRKLALAPSPLPAGAPRGAGQDAQPSLVGAHGVAQTNLRPAGTAVIDGKSLDVVAENGYVDADTPLRVVAIRGNAIIVRPESA